MKAEVIYETANQSFLGLLLLISCMLQAFYKGWTGETSTPRTLVTERQGHYAAITNYPNALFDMLEPTVFKSCWLFLLVSLILSGGNFVPVHIRPVEVVIGRM